MNTQDLVSVLKKSLGENLVSVVLYGSVAHGDVAAGANVLVLVQRNDADTLRNLATSLSGWRRAKNPPPMILSEREFQRSQDVFPIEYLDIRLFHRVLYGPSPFKDTEPDRGHLRAQLEFELRSKLIQLRQAYLAIAYDKAALQKFLLKSLSSFSVLFKTILHLTGKPVPAQKREVWKALSEFISLDTDVFDLISSQRGNPQEWFARLLANVETVVRYVDEFQGGLK